MRAAVNPGRHKLSERKDDLNETPRCAVDALLREWSRPTAFIWEPACGRGAICKPLRESGCHVTATDLVGYGYGLGGYDFLMETKAINGSQCIITNPPYKLADKFVRHALELCPWVVMLLRLAFLEGARRSDVLDGGRLKEVLVFRNRLPMMHRDGWTGPKIETGSVAYAWFIWGPGPYLLPTVRRISA